MHNLMKVWTPLVCLLTLGVVGGAWADALSFYTPPIVTAPLMSTAPNIDGLVERGEWAEASAMHPLVSLGGRSQPSAQTDVMIGYTRHALYISATMHDPAPGEIKAEVTDRDGAVWRDDSLELFFDPNHKGKEYIHFVVNALGVRYDAYNTDEQVDYRWEAKTARLETGWSAEMLLPFEGDVEPSPGAVWGFVAARNSPHLNEMSATSRHMKSFLEPENFGGVIFGSKPATMKIVALGQGQIGMNQAAIVLSNSAAKNFSGKVHVRIMGASKYGNYYGAQKVTVAAGEVVTVQVPYKLAQDGLNTLQVSLTDAAGNTLNRTPPYALSLPAVGDELASLENTLTAALRVWSVLDASDYKVRAGRTLDGLLVQWREVAGKYKLDRKRMTIEQLVGLKDEMADIGTRSELVKRELESYMQTQASVGVSVEAVDTLCDASASDGDLLAAYLSAPRGGLAATQLVIRPFPASSPED